MDYTFRVLSTWPGTPTPAAKRIRSQFSAKYSQTLALLRTELTHLKARNVVIEADCDARMIRQDGQLRADARLNGPGIVLSFESKAGPMRFPCDRFLNWDCNLRAIALTLQHLRAVDRYGVTQRAEQYRGWAALPDKRNDSEFSHPLAAAAWMAAKARDILGDEHVVAAHLTEIPDVRTRIYRRLVAALHPDRRGSDVEFKQLQAAIQVLQT